MQEGEAGRVGGVLRPYRDTPATRYLAGLGVRHLPRLTTPFDPGYDPATLASHLEQSGHLMAGLKLSMAGWLLATDGSTRAKIEAARSQSVATVAGGSSFEVAVAQR